jgi:hypothetical protein
LKRLKDRCGSGSDAAHFQPCDMTYHEFHVSYYLTCQLPEADCNCWESQKHSMEVLECYCHWISEPKK